MSEKVENKTPGAMPDTHVILRQIACENCGASWIPETMPTDTCPYCGMVKRFSEVASIRIPCNDFEPHAFVFAEQDRASGQAQYTRAIRAVVRGLWVGALDINQAFEAFETTVRSGLTGAQHEALRSVGLLPADASPEERTALAIAIARETSFIFPFLLDIEAGSKANGGKLGPFLARADMWGLRWADVYNLALTMAKNDPKLQWQINVVRVVKRNCDSCLRLNGQTRRASFFRRKGIRPQNPPNDSLICGGWECGCGLVAVSLDTPLSRGPLPKLP